MIRWTKEQEEYLIEIHKGKLNQEIADLINKRFNTSYTASSISAKKVKLNLKSDVNISLKKQKYDKKIMNYIVENYKGKSSIELTDEVNKKFNLNLNVDKLQNIKSNMRRRYGYIFTEKAKNGGKYKKGNVPMNKGKKWNEYMTKEQQERAKKTWFKKGNISANNVPIGTERVTKDGFIEIKIKDGKGNKNWIAKHRYIYEQHYGKIPKGYKIIFLDGNKNNLDIDNLKMVSNVEELIMNNRKLRYTKKELTETGYLIAKIINKQGKIKNERL